MGEQRPLEALSGGAEAVLPAGEPHPLGPWQVPCAPGSLGSLRSPLPGQTSPTHNSPTPSRWKTQRTTQEGQLWEGTICVATLPPQAMGGIKEPRGAVSAERLEGGAQGAPPPWPGPLSSSASSPTAQVTGSSGFGDVAPVAPRALFFTTGAQAVLWDSEPPSQCLSFLSAGAWAQSGLTQEASVSRSLGQSVTLTCTGSSNHVGFYGAGWFQHRPGAVPRTVMWGSSRSSGLRARLSGSRSGSTASLSISGLQAEDKADYYCHRVPAASVLPRCPGMWGRATKNSHCLMALCG